jgi:GTPase SAR1 family protein
MKTRIQLYTVPGQVYYNTTRKLVLRGCDGVVFVADSQIDLTTANKESLENLKQNLLEQGDDLSKMPMVIQYNKRDLKKITPLEELKATLNKDGRPEFEAVATEGTGVFQTLKQLIKMTFKKIAAEQGINLSIKVKEEPTATALQSQSISPIEQKDKEDIGLGTVASKEKPEKVTISFPDKQPVQKEKRITAALDEKLPMDDFTYVPTIPTKVPETEKKEIPKEKKEKNIVMGYDKELDDISPAASVYLLEMQEMTKEQEEVAKKAAEKTTKEAIIPKTKIVSDDLPESTIPKSRFMETDDEIFSGKPEKINKIAEEIRVEVSNNEVSIDQAGIRVPIKIRIPKSMQNLNFRFDMQIIVEEEKS